jgi:hypothetical protein
MLYGLAALAFLFVLCTQGPAVALWCLGLIGVVTVIGVVGK